MFMIDVHYCAHALPVCIIAPEQAAASTVISNPLGILFILVFCIHAIITIHAIVIHPCRASAIAEVLLHISSTQSFSNRFRLLLQ